MAWGKPNRSRDMQNARRRTWSDFKIKDNTMDTVKITEEDRSFVLQTLGEASIGMWDVTPSGQFDSEKAIEFADRIIERMEQIAQR